MLSAKEAMERSEKARKERLNGEWKKLKKKLKKAIKQGKTSFTVKSLSYEAKKKLKQKGFEIEKTPEGFERVSWEQSLS